MMQCVPPLCRQLCTVNIRTVNSPNVRFSHNSAHPGVWIALCVVRVWKTLIRVLFVLFLFFLPFSFCVLSLALLSVSVSLCLCLSPLYIYLFSFHLFSFCPTDTSVETVDFLLGLPGCVFNPNRRSKWERYSNQWKVAVYFSQTSVAIFGKKWSSDFVSDFATRVSGVTPMQIAASNGRLVNIRYLIRRGAAFDTKDALGRTALDRSVVSGPFPVSV